MIKTLVTAAAMILGAQTACSENAPILEIAWFKLHPGTEAASMLDGAQHVQDHFLSRFDGRIYRELMVESGGDYWIDSIRWNSVGDFAKAAAEILTDPDGAPIMELIDPATMAWFHADRVRHWRKSDIPRGDGYTEIQVFRLAAPGSELEFLMPTTDEAFLAAAEALQPSVEAQPGFADRELFRTADGWWIDLIHWQSGRHAEAARNGLMADMADPNSTAMQFLLQIDPKSLKTFGMNQQRVW